MSPGTDSHIHTYCYVITRCNKTPRYIIIFKLEMRYVYRRGSKMMIWVIWFVFYTVVLVAVYIEIEIVSIQSTNFLGA